MTSLVSVVLIVNQPTALGVCVGSTCANRPVRTISFAHHAPTRATGCKIERGAIGAHIRCGGRQNARTSSAGPVAPPFGRAHDFDQGVDLRRGGHRDQSIGGQGARPSDRPAYPSQRFHDDGHDTENPAGVQWCHPGWSEPQRGVVCTVAARRPRLGPHTPTLLDWNMWCRSLTCPKTGTPRGRTDRWTCKSIRTLRPSALTTPR